MDSIFSEFEDDDEPQTSGEITTPAPPGPAPIPPLRPWGWGALIMDLLLDPQHAEEVVIAHGTTSDEVMNLIRTNKEFQTALRECKSRLAAHGPNAGFVLRSQVMAEELLPRVYKLASHDGVPPAVALRAIENVVNWGRMDPRHDKDRTTATDAGVHVTFNFQGVPGDIPKIVAVESTREIGR